MLSRTLKATTPLLLTVGFAAGVAFVASCGGGGDGASAGGGGSQVVRHAFDSTVPIVVTSASFVTNTADTITYTPGNANDVPLRIRVTGNVDVADDSATILVSQVTPLGAFGLAAVPVPVGTNQDFTILASLPAVGFVGVAPATTDFQVNVQGPFVLPPATSSTTVTFNSLRFELVTAEGVVVSDPSPQLQ